MGTTKQRSTHGQGSSVRLDVGGHVIAVGLVDEVCMDVAPVVFGSGKRFFGSAHAQHLLEDPDVVLRGNRVLHLRYPVRH